MTPYLPGRFTKGGESVQDDNIIGLHGRADNKVLIREYNRFELVSIRLDEGRFIEPVTEDGRSAGQIS